MKLDDCISFLAEYGCSKNSVAKVLDMPMETFLGLCSAMPDVKWKPKGQTIGDLRALKKRHLNAQKRLAHLQESQAVTLDTVVTLFGQTGTIRQIADQFASVNRRSVLHRLRLGFSLEQAILMPTNRGPAKHEDVQHAQ